MDASPGNATSSDTPNQQSLKPPRLRHQFSNVILNSPTFNDVDGDLSYHIGETSENGLHLLRKAASLGAIHDSSERFPVAKCEPGTRERTLKAILDWIKDPDPSSHIFSLYGPPNSEGTTSVLQSIAESCASSDELRTHLGGSFFFSKDTAGRDKGHYLFLTIAYQLAMNVPILRDPINRIICANPALPTKSISVQLESLVVRAFQNIEPNPQLSITVIIDGLDQCQDNDTQLLILNLIADVVTGKKAPLRFLIGSRPKSRICGAFDESMLYSITQSVFLDESYDRKKSTRPQNGAQLNSDDNSTNIGERANNLVSGPGSDRKVMVSEKKLAALEKNLDDLKLMHAKIIDQNRSLKVENESLERRLKIRDISIRNLEALLRATGTPLVQRNKVPEAQLQEVKERIDRARGDMTQETRKIRQNKGNNFSSTGENPTEGKVPDEAGHWPSTRHRARPSENPTEGKRPEPDEASDFRQHRV